MTLPKEARPDGPSGSLFCFSTFPNPVRQERAGEITTILKIEICIWPCDLPRAKSKSQSRAKKGHPPCQRAHCHGTDYISQPPLQFGVATCPSSSQEKVVEMMYSTSGPGSYEPSMHDAPASLSSLSMMHRDLLEAT